MMKMTIFPVMISCVLCLLAFVASHRLGVTAGGMETAMWRQLADDVSTRFGVVYGKGIGISQPKQNATRHIGSKNVKPIRRRHDKSASEATTAIESLQRMMKIAAILLLVVGATISRCA